MNYLDIFNDAKIWIKYVHFLSRKYYKNDFLEIGAGIGSFTDGYKKDIKNIFLTEIDERNVNILKTKYQDDPNIKVFNKKVVEIDKKFNTIAHYNVLEHIEDDVKEIYDCLDNINKNGYLVILVPAHNELYSKLDKEVGHYKRYDKSFFQKLDLKGNSIVELKYVDCLGYLLYYLNKMFFKNETYPSKLKIFIWDKIITPFTIVFDFLTAYKLGKNILCVIKKNN